MKKKILQRITLLTIICLSFASCKYEYAWINDVFFTYQFPPVTENGDFNTSATIRRRDIHEVDLNSQEIVDIVGKEARLAITGDIQTGDSIYLSRIIVNTDTLYFNNGYKSNSDTYAVAFFEDNKDFQKLMVDAMNTLEKKGYIKVSVDGYMEMNKAKLYVTLVNKVDVRIRE